MYDHTIPTNNKSVQDIELRKREIFKRNVIDLYLIMLMY